MTAGGRRDRRGWGWHSPSLLGCTNTDSGRKVPGKKNNRKRYRAPPLSETFHHCRCLSGRKKPKSHLGESPLACVALLCPVQPTQQQPGPCQPLWSRRLKKTHKKNPSDAASSCTSGSFITPTLALPSTSSSSYLRHGYLGEAAHYGAGASHGGSRFLNYEPDVWGRMGTQRGGRRKLCPHFLSFISRRCLSPPLRHSGKWPWSRWIFWCLDKQKPQRGSLGST